MTTTSRRAVPLYLLGGGLSLLGNSAIGIVLPWLVISRTGDLSVAALVATAAGIAAVPATLWAGRLADRFGARRVAVAADLGSAASVAALAVVDGIWGLTTTWFIVLGVAGALFDVPGMTARQSLLADVAEKGGAAVDTVASAFQGSFSLALLVGPAITGLLLSHLEPIDVVWVTAACSLGAALATWWVPVANPTHGAADQAEARGGWAVIGSDRRLQATLVISFGASLVVPPLMAVVLPGHFAMIGRPGAFGVTVSVFAVGVIVGSVAYAFIAKRSRLAAYLVAMGAMAGGLAVIAGLGPVVVIAVGMACVGAGSGLYGPVWNVFVAEQVDPRSRARVLSWMTALTLVAGPLGLGALSLFLIVGDLETAAVVIAALWAVIAVFAVASPSARAVAR
ncbi:MAG: MFS transporter [Aeromicrobium sp.]|uniref:MFS transporter n=1 Tax=Aeromicrobium sp. TaxID=1871063 RepID=UPI0039E38E71